jgi:hypothetical protein
MKPTLKTAADVPQLVDDLFAASPDVAAIGDDSYCVVDLDRPKVRKQIERILEEFGPRDHLVQEFINCLKARGRWIRLNPDQYDGRTTH